MFVRLFMILKHGFRMNLNALDCRMIKISHAHLSDPLNDAQIYSWVFKMDYFLTFYLNLMRVARHTSYYVVITFALTFPLVCQPKKIMSCKRPLEKTLSSFSRHKKAEILISWVSHNSFDFISKSLIYTYFALCHKKIGNNRSIWQ